MPVEHAPEPASQHVSTEQVADLLEGLLPDAEAAAVAAHLVDCARCARLRDDLAALPSMLAATPDPPMPAHLAARLDAALVRAAAEREAGRSRPAPVTALDSRRRFATRALTGVAAAAAVVVGFVVVGDVVDQTGSAEDASTSAESAGGTSSSDQEQDGGVEEADPRLGPRELARLDTRDFRADVAAALVGTADGENLVRAQADALGESGTCSGMQLRAAGIAGRFGPPALLDDEPVVLVASGRRTDSLVVAYSCANGAPVEQYSARVDLSR